MPYEPCQLVLDSMNWKPVDSEGTCKIYHGSPDRADSSFARPGNIAEVRNVEFHFHMQPDIVHNRTMDPFDPSMAQFKRECPVWYFVDDATNNIPKPTFNIILVHHGIGLMKSLTLSGFEEVTMKVVAGSEIWKRAKRGFPSESSMAALRRRFENQMGRATVIGAGEECCMVFNPSGFVKSRL